MAKLNTKTHSTRGRERRTALQSHNIALNTAKIGAWEVDLKNYSMSVSDEYKALWGLNPDDPFDPQRVYTAIHPDSRATVEKAFFDAVAKNIPYVSEYCINHPDGSLRWHSSFGVRGENNNDRMFGVTLDITERKRASDVLRGLSRGANESFAATL